MKRPSFQFYPGDWLQDLQLRLVSVGARGLWIDMLCMMHQGSDYGYLKVNHTVILDANLASVVGATIDEVKGWLSELEKVGSFSRDADGCIFSRRMVRDEQIRAARAAGGILGGNPALMKGKGKSETKDQKVNLPSNLEPTPSSPSPSPSPASPKREDPPVAIAPAPPAVAEDAFDRSRPPSDGSGDGRSFPRPEWIPEGVWSRFLDHRERMAGMHPKSPKFSKFEMRAVAIATERAMQMRGISAEEALEEAMRQGMRKPSYPDHAETPAGRMAPAEFESSLSAIPGRPPSVRRPGDVTLGTWEAWTAMRKKKRAPVTEFVLNMARADGDKHGIALENLLKAWVYRGTTGYKAEWDLPRGGASNQPNSNGRQLNKQERLEESNRQITDAFIKERFGDDE